MTRASVAVVFALPIALAACAELRWARPDGSAADLEQDGAQCRQQARLDARRTLPDRISQPTVVTDRDGRASVVRSPPGNSERFLLEHDLVAACMRAKGYVRVPADSGK